MSDVVYRTDTCPSCEVLEAQLSKNPIPGLRVLNIDRDPVARDYFNQMSVLTGVRAVPTAVIDGSPVTGAYPILAALRRKYGKP